MAHHWLSPIWLWLIRAPKPFRSISKRKEKLFHKIKKRKLEAESLSTKVSILENPKISWWSLFLMLQNSQESQWVVYLATKEWTLIMKIFSKSLWMKMSKISRIWKGSRIEKFSTLISLSLSRSLKKWRTRMTTSTSTTDKSWSEKRRNKRKLSSKLQIKYSMKSWERKI